MRHRVGEWLNGLPRYMKTLLLGAFDVVALFGVLWLSLGLRLGGVFNPTPPQMLLMAVAPLVALPVFHRLGLYRTVIRYLPERAVWTVLRAMVLATLAWVFLLFIAESARFGVIPRSIPIFYFLLGTIVVAGGRFSVKTLLWGPRGAAAPEGARMVVYGAGEAGQQLLAALRSLRVASVVAFVDDDRGLQGREVMGLRVHAPSRLAEIVRDTGASEVIIALSEIEADRRREVVAGLANLDVKIRTLPAIGEIASGKYVVSRLRNIDIDDLIGRSTVPADPDLLRPMIENRTVMVTGAGGSIGSELCRIIATWGPRRLVLLEANEFALYELERALAGRAEFEVVPVLGSVADAALVSRTIRSHGVEAVFHAAAHKHVPLVEANALEGISNNVFGTLALVDAAFDLGVADFVLVSTDKAVRPTNVMGATKRWAELIVCDAGLRAAARGSGQRFCAVRFGNVLGSNGSVVPLFREQIAAGGPVTVTDERMTRYFMSIHEAAELIVQAGRLSQGGDLFLLDMGQPVRIRDLAENMIRLAGLSVRSPEEPDGDIAIAITGARPGEKLYEELFYDPAQACPTAHAKILRARLDDDRRADLASELGRLRDALERADEAEARRILFSYIAPGQVAASATTEPATA